MGAIVVLRDPRYTCDMMEKRFSPAGPRAKRNPTRPASIRPARPAPSVVRWLLLIHQIPPKPDYLRVKIGRRLQRVGAVAIKNSVYALPATPAAFEDFRWIVREI